MDKITKKTLYIIRAVSFLIWIVLSLICVYASLHGESFLISYSGTVYFTLYLFPYLLVGALYGYLISMFTFVMAFICSLIFTMSTSYNMSIYLVATLSISLFAQYGFFKTVKRSFIAILLTQLLTSFAEFACLSVIQNNQFTDLRITDYFDFISKDLLTDFVVGTLFYLLFSKAPDIIKILFPVGISYTEAYQKNQEFQRGIRKTRVSMKITAIIIALELILGLSVAVYMMVLFPDLKAMFTRHINDDGPHTSITESYQRDKSAAPSDEDYLGQLQSKIDSGEIDSSSDEYQMMLDKISNASYKFDEIALSVDIKMILLMLCVGVPMAAIANYYTKMTIGAPIGHMSDFLFEYANADDDKRLEVGEKIDKMHIGTRDEIQVLHESMRTTVHSVHDYIDRVKAEKELEKELEIAQKSSEAKSSFLSNMSHEIRTPINAVLGMNEMILRESDDPRIQEYANNVKSAGNSLLGIINDILDFSKIEAGKMDILPVQYHLGSTINDLINMVASKANDKGLSLELNIDPTLPTHLIGDEIRIKQCVTNVLSNAVKYTEEGSVTLNISYTKLDDKNISLRFQVIDTGIGIKEEDLNKLYSPFERIEEIRNRSVEGTGLGMSIVKKLLALMDTKLDVKSVYGEGSDFSFEVRQQVVSWEELGDFRKKYKEYLESLEKYHEKFRAPSAKILVVDDTPMNLTVVKGLLKSTMIEIDTAESGFETLDKVKGKKYDAIFIDHRMSEMDGIETLAAMKELDGNLNIGVPCIALTANAGQGAREDYIAAGFDDYLSKPVDGELMEDMLKDYLPKEKVLLAGSKEFEELSSASADTKNKDANENRDNVDERENIFRSLVGISYEDALKNCGSLDVLENVIEEFYVSLDSKAQNIENFEKEKDYRNYTVAVHALKSSARLIGANKLSEDAAYLEKCGNEENISEITEKTSALLSLYRSYKDKLSPAIKKEDSDKPEIPADELESAFADMKELLEAYDFDTADGIIKMLADYSIPDGYKDKYKKVVELMAAVDRDGLLGVL